MNPLKYNLALYRGDSRGWLFRMWADEAKTEPADLDGAEIRAEIRDKSAGSQIVDLDIVFTSPNIVQVTITPPMYATCPAKGIWDLQITYPDGWVDTPVGGTVAVTADATDSLPMPKGATR
jgi:hypothetical protein